MSYDQRVVNLIKQSGLFDSDWYSSNYPDVAASGVEPLQHYLLIGGPLGRRPSRLFDAAYYLHSNEDVRDAGMPPLVHYVLSGCEEGRSPVGPASFRAPAAARIEIIDAPSDALVVQHPLEILASPRPIVFIAGESIDKPGYQYRVERYVEAFKRCGERVLAIPRNKIPETMDEISRAKLVVIWRAAFRQDIADVIHAARAAGAAIFFDVDDLMVRPEFATPEIIDAIRYGKKDAASIAKLYTDMRRTMTAVDFCSASTHELAWHMRRIGKRRPTFVLPNGFSEETYLISRVAARAKTADGLVRIGYASGGSTHQADFRLCAEAVAETLRAHRNARLVLFRKGKIVTLDVSEFPALQGLEDQIEWREFVPHHDLPKEVARFDINLAPLEFGNPFVEAKSELKFFEAAICDVPTVASPTGPFKRCIEHGVSGFLAYTMDDWRSSLLALAGNAGQRSDIAREAHRKSLWPFGPMKRTELAHTLLGEIVPGRSASHAFHYATTTLEVRPRTIPLSEHTVSFEHDTGRESRVTIIIPLHNYENYISEALESAKCQTLNSLDLIVVDDCSNDSSQTVARNWLVKNAQRFNRALLVQHVDNKGLGASRNTAFDLADSLYVMALDADNRLHPECCEKCLHAIAAAGAGFAYPKIQRFGNDEKLMGERSYFPRDFMPGNGIDAMAMISKEAWSLVGGYTTHRMGWQDYDFWCRLVDCGIHGVHVGEILAEYRAHGKSMLSRTNKKSNKVQLLDWMEAEHPWLSLTSAERTGYQVSRPSDRE